jgi:selenoprotein W-related protein
LPGGVILIPSSGGVLEVSLGERTLFSKKAAGRFPEEGEVLGTLSEVLEPSA